MHNFSSPLVCLNSWERRREVLSTLLRFWCRTVPLLLLNAAFLLVELAARFYFFYFLFLPTPYLLQLLFLILQHASAFPCPDRLSFNCAVQPNFLYFYLQYTFGLSIILRRSCFRHFSLGQLLIWSREIFFLLCIICSIPLCLLLGGRANILHFFTNIGRN